MERTIVFDAEANDLLVGVTVCHCISTYCIEEDEARHFGPTEIEEGLRYLGTATRLVGHNIAGYDFKMFNKLYSWSPGKGQEIIDTFMISCLMYPEGRHGLDYWAKRLHLNQQKVEHEDWSTYSDDMKWRCDSDVIIGTKVYEYLIGEFEKTRGDFNKALDLEQEVAYIHAQQVIDGVKLDIPKAIKLYKELKDELRSLEMKILRDVPKTVSIVGIAKAKQEEARSIGTKGQAARTKAGSFASVNKNYFGKDDEGVQVALGELEKAKEVSYNTIRAEIDLEEAYDKVCAKGPFTKIKIDTLNLNSPVQVSKLLLDLGWNPTEYNSKKLPDGSWVRTGPKLTEDSYSSLPPGLGQDIARYNILKHRKGMLLTRRKKDGKWTGLLALACEREEGGRGDGRISADGFTCGTNTGRYRHFGVVNIPRPSTPYGSELRELFTVPKDSYLIGADLSGIEAVVLAHYCLPYKGGQDLVDEILKGDFHQANADLWGVDRNTAKSILYALMYGAGAAKLESIANSSMNGNAIKAAFYAKYPAIYLLIEDLEASYSIHSTYIKTLDGRRVYIRSKHKLLNTLIQSAAAIIFKEWMIKVDEFLPSYAKQVIAMHDEIQVECDCGPQHAGDIGRVICELATEVGKELGIKVPVTAEYKIGANWKDTH